MRTPRLTGLAVVALATACGAPSATPGAARPAPSALTAPPAPTPDTSARRHPAKPSAGTNATKADPLFPKRAAGWKTVKTRAELAAIDAFAVGYASFLAKAKTPRRAVAELVRGFAPGALALPGKRKGTPAPGTRFLLAGPAGKAAAFIRLGNRPIEEGARIIVAAVDAPRIDLKQQPLYDKAGFAMLDTVLYGSVRLESWLVQPLALYIHVSRPGAADGDAKIVVGEAATDPVLVIPDLLPHLAGKVQRPRIVDKAERMDAIGARSRRGLINFLRKHGVDAKVFASAEVSLVPAGSPSFIGVDRALLAGYGHSHRAMAYAAVHSLAGKPVPHHTAIVIVVNKAEIGYTGSSGLGFVRIALNRILASLAGQEPDVLTTRRFFARSAALVADRHGGKRNKGLVLNPRGDDALPGATRRVLDALGKAKAPYQIATASNWGSPTRRLGQLGMDVVDVGIPSTGHGTPRELVSVLDLYSAYRGCIAWLVKP